MAVVIRKSSKYRNKKVTIDGYVFASKKEGERYLQLFAMEKHGLIRALSVHPRFPIYVNGKLVCSYESDFSYVRPLRGGSEKFEMVVEDVKSKATRTPLYRLKKKLVEAVYGIEINEV